MGQFTIAYEDMKMESGITLGTTSLTGGICRRWEMKQYEWPKDVPDDEGDYLVRIYGSSFDEWAVANYFGNGWLRYNKTTDEWDDVSVLYWWNLPEVTE